MSVSTGSESSSIDGSINDSFESSSPDPAIMFSPSPAESRDISFDATIPRNRQEPAVKTMKEETTEYSFHVEKNIYNFDESVDTDERSKSNILDKLGAVDSIPNCNKISSILSDLGYPSVQIVSSDIDPATR